MKPCLVCGKPTRGNRCPEHAVDRGYETPYWKALRRAVLIRDGFLCQLQLEGCTRRATTVHLDPAKAGDHRSATAADCLAACAHCHGMEDAPRAVGY